MSSFGVETDRLERDARFTSGPIRTSKLWTPSEIATSAELGASVMFELFGADKAEVTDKLTADYEVVVDGYTGPVDTENDAIVGLTLGEEGSDWVSPSQLVAGYNRMSFNRGFQGVCVWEDIYVGKRVSWWNQRTPQGTISKLKTDLISGLISVGGLHGLCEGLKYQQDQLRTLVSMEETDHTTTVGMAPQDWLVRDATAIITGTERLDTATFTIFPQHERDAIYFGKATAPIAQVLESRAYLKGHCGHSDEGGGFRVVVGQKAT